MPNTYEQIRRLVSILPYSDLKRLREVVDNLLEEGYMPAQGHLDYRFITRGGKCYGPYKYRRRWTGGKLVDHYEGKATPEEYQAWLEAKARNSSQPTRP
jgi:hypothetical protein